MIPVHGKKRYAWRLIFMSIAVVLGAGAPRAQTGPLLPSVDLRRDVRLDSEVWPADFNGDGITDLVASRAATSSQIVRRVTADVVRIRLRLPRYG